MAGRLTAWVTLAVLATHLLLLQVLGAQWHAPSALATMSKPFFTRELTAQAPKAISTITPKPVAPKSRASYHAAKPVSASVTSSVPESSTDTVASGVIPQFYPTQTGTGPAVPLEVEAQAPGLPGARIGSSSDSTETPVASGSAKLPAAASLDSWPNDTRLSYVVKGYYRGPVGGEAHVQWQRDGGKYQVKVELDLGLFLTWQMTSQGIAQPEGLEPQTYEEKRVGANPLRISMDSSSIQLNDGRRVDRPSEAQDTASQFVELGHRFATGRAALNVGNTVKMWLTRPNGVAEWTYDIAAQDTVNSARLGPIQAFHLKPRPLDKPSGPTTAEMWFAPSLQYLPVRIKLNINSESWMDLVIEKIEQADRSNQASPPGNAGGKVPVPVQ